MPGRTDLRRLALALLAGSLVAASPSGAAVRCVAPAAGSSCTASYANLPDAVAAASPGATISLGAGTYAGASTSKLLHFVGAGAGTLTAPANPARQTVIAAQPGEPALTLQA